MQISEGFRFNPNELKILGFTDLGDHTPENQTTARADHALVLLFQPFRGQWVQNIAAFLSKGAANGEVLNHLITECIVHLENHGFFVDVMTSDGASWNRNMWARFGVAKFEASCVHPCSIESVNDEMIERWLWFVSDFSHLVKNLRNFMFSKEEIMVAIFGVFVMFLILHTTKLCLADP